MILLWCLRNWQGLVVGAGIAFLTAYPIGWLKGKVGAVQQIEQANDASEGKADAAERGVIECPAGKWNREKGVCENEK